MRHITGKQNFFFALVCGANDNEERLSSWIGLRRCEKNLNDPWAVYGDFNNVLSTTERNGDNIPTQSEIMPFKHCLEDF